MKDQFNDEMFEEEEVDEDCGQSEILAKMCQPWNESALQVNNS
jgi:hypothetical protein